MRSISHIFISLTLLLLGVSLSFAGYSQQPNIVDTVVNQRSTDDLAEIKKRKRLRALVTYSRSDFFFSKDGAPAGFQVEVLNEFEKHLNQGVKRETDRIRIQLVPTTFDQLIPDLIAGRGDIAAALLTVTPEREAIIDIVTAGKLKVNEVVVTHKSVQAMESLDDLSGKEVYVLKGSSYVEHLSELNEQFLQKGVAPIQVIEAEPFLVSGDILELVNSGVIKITVVDDYKARLWAKVLPNIVVKESIAIAQGTTIGWGIREQNVELRKSLQAFLKKVKKGTYLGNILFNRYFKRTKWITNPLSDSYRARLTALIDVFKKYGEDYGFDYLALVAQGFQESKLNQNLKSHRGALGVMQLLPSTAADKNVAISGIDVAENNIHAGVKYLAFIKRRYFSTPDISDLDSMALSWAAYNAGPARVGQMRKLAKKMGLNPNVWHGNVELAAGKIVGRETVQYVNNIFKYYIAYSLLKEQNQISGKSW